ncbi:MAG: zinc-dependent metalloprotease [Acidimicrobiia bacterium]
MSDDPQFLDPDDDPSRSSHPSNEPMNPFGPGGFDLSKIDLNEVVRMLQSDGPVNWDIAKQMATSVALGEEGTPDAPVTPADQTQLDELVRAAQTHVVAETGLTATYAAPLRILGRSEWALLHLDALAPVLEALAVTFRTAIVEESAAEDLGPEAAAIGPFGMPMGGDALSGLMGMMAPVLLGVQAGSMVGYLAQHALGRYDLPLPASDPPSLCFVVTNLDAFETAWSLDRNDLRFVVALHEVVRAAERSVPWVQPKLVGLATEYVSAYELDRDALESQLGGFDPTDPSSMSGITEHPEALLGAMRSPRQEEILARLQTVTSVLEGYAEVVVHGIGSRLAGSFEQVHEALARHRVERGEAGRFIEGLLGLQLERADYEQGQAFCRGVIERAGLDGLNRLWEAESMLPTPAELEAPGLWLARIELPA